MKKLLLAFAMLPVLGATAQNKKVMLFDFTGIKCGWCPEGAVIAEELKKDNPQNFLPVAIHTSGYTPATSPLRTTEGDAIDDAAMPSGYPAGAVDMKKYSSNPNIAMGRGSWAAAFADRLAVPAIVSIGFTKAKRTNDSTYEAEVTVKFTSAPVAGTPLKLQVFVIEDSIKALPGSSVLAQDNYSPDVQGGASPLDPWYHNAVLRKALGGTWGFADVIPATPVVNTVYTKKISFTRKAGATPTGWVAKNLKVYAFVAYDGAASADKKEILNGEEISHFQFAHPNSVNEVKSNVQILNAYPNPASINNVVKIEYNTVQSAKITMNVYNALGQLVATPYDGEEVVGMHTIHFNPSYYGLVPGTYFLHLTNGTETQVSQITLQ